MESAKIFDAIKRFFAAELSENKYRTGTLYKRKTNLEKTDAQELFLQRLLEQFGKIYWYFYLGLKFQQNEGFKHSLRVR